MTFLAENQLSALYVPAQFVSRIHLAYVEVAMFFLMQMADEARHVHFGLSHVRHALTHDVTLYARLEAAVSRRAATLHGIGGVPAPVQDALTILAAGGDEPSAVARGHTAFRELLEDMHTGRVRRLVNAGLTAAQAQRLSDLHTPNFM